MRFRWFLSRTRRLSVAIAITALLLPLLVRSQRFARLAHLHQARQAVFQRERLDPPQWLGSGITGGDREHRHISVAESEWHQLLAIKYGRAAWLPFLAVEEDPPLDQFEYFFMEEWMRGDPGVSSRFLTGRAVARWRHERALYDELVSAWPARQSMARLFRGISGL